MPASARHTPNAAHTEAGAQTDAAQATAAATRPGHVETGPTGCAPRADAVDAFAPGAAQAAAAHDATASASLPGVMSVADLLGRVGAELAERAAAVERLQPLAAGLAEAARPGPDPEALRALQGLDLTEQTLRALAGVLADLARAAPASWQIDASQALAAVPLAGLANRLAGATTGQPAEADGDCEFW
jgi:hypothetical protein